MCWQQACSQTREAPSPAFRADLIFVQWTCLRLWSNCSCAGPVACIAAVWGCIAAVWNILLFLKSYIPCYFRRALRSPSLRPALWPVLMQLKCQCCMTCSCQPTLSVLRYTNATKQRLKMWFVLILRKKHNVESKTLSYNEMQPSAAEFCWPRSLSRRCHWFLGSCLYKHHCNCM